MNQIRQRGALATVALIGNHPPRQCGIATFTADLAAALTSLEPSLDVLIVAMNDGGRRHQYPPIVRFEIDDAVLTDYRRAADFLNVNHVDAVSVQHEYGIFGGEAGAHLLSLVRELRMPVVTTLHTLREQPSPEQRSVLDELCSLSERVVVMSAPGAELLRRVHQVPVRRIDVIPHGAPAAPAALGAKELLGLEGRRVLLTLGLLSPDKGVESVIEALPAVIAEWPDVVYVVVGATHPHVREHQGEAYRLMLEARVRRLGLEAHVHFHDRFVSNPELAQFVGAADIVLTPYRNAEQSTSGTLAYAVAAGKSVISTPFMHACELLAEGRGVLVPWGDSGAIAREVSALFSDTPRRTEVERRAESHARDMSWPVVARAYLRSLHHASRESGGRARAPSAPLGKLRSLVLPELQLGHLRTLTDDTGVFQHAAYCVPRYEDGYCLDDNARALALLTVVESMRVEPPQATRLLAIRYFAFLRAAFDRETGRFRNLYSHSRRWSENAGSEDSHGRALWALGTVVARCDDPGRRQLAAELFVDALPALLKFTSPRAWAYGLLGLAEMLRWRPEAGFVDATQQLAARLMGRWEASARGDWRWFEDRLTYCNARLPQALMAAGVALREARWRGVALESLEWLVAQQRSADGSFAPIGSNGFFVRGGERAQFDQQPVDATCTVSACLLAARVTGEARWIEQARTAFGWFMGENALSSWLYDAATGGCRDGLHAMRVNENQGAESTISFLASLLEMRLAEHPLRLLDGASERAATDMGRA